MGACQPCQALHIALARLVEVLTPSATEWERRRHVVSEHLHLLRSKLKPSHPIRISVFGSSLSGLCLAGSDIDLGLFGTFHGCPLENLNAQAQKTVLRLVLKAVYAAKLAQNQQVQPIWGARVPVLKYTCSLSGLECDVSLQGAGALVKANIIHILNSNSQHLSALYRLVKFWAQAHDLNDASRNTFNSTSLLYMTIFYLQQRQLLPPLKELVPSELLLQPNARLLQGSNKQLWADPQQLQQLLHGVQGSMTAWAEQRQQQQQRGESGVCELLQGFFQLWSGALSNWVLGKDRHLHADLWHGTWTRGSFPKEYVFSLQDPFDPDDCSARAVGSTSNTNGGTAAFIAYMFDCSSKVIQRYRHNCTAQQCGASAAEGHQHHWFRDLQRQEQLRISKQSTAAGGVVARVELCKVLSWLFGPPVVSMLGSVELQRQTTPAAQSSTASGVAWAAAPFPQSLVVEVQLRQQADAAPSALIKWLVEQLGAEVDSNRNILCLKQLPLLCKQVSDAAVAAAKQVRGSLLKQSITQATPAAVGRCTETRLAQQQQQQQQRAIRDEPADPDQQQQEQHQQLAHQQQQAPQQVHPVTSSSSSKVPFHGPPLPDPDSGITQLQQQLALELQQQQHRLIVPPISRPPSRLPKVIKTAVQFNLAAVADRLLQLQQHGHGSSSSSKYGFVAVLEQHGFNSILQGLGLLRNGCIWPQVLPADKLEGSSSSSLDPAAGPPPAAGDDWAAEPRLIHIMLAASGGTEPPEALRYLYTVIHAANKHHLAAAKAAGCSSSALAAAAATAGVAGGKLPVYTAARREQPEGGTQRQAVVQLPELVSVVWGTEQCFEFKQVVPAGSDRHTSLHNGYKKANRSTIPGATTLARITLKWLGSKPAVVAAVKDALEILELMPQQKELQLVMVRQAHQQRPQQQPQQPPVEKLQATSEQPQARQSVETTQQQAVDHMRRHGNVIDVRVLDGQSIYCGMQGPAAAAGTAAAAAAGVAVGTSSNGSVVASPGAHQAHQVQQPAQPVVKQQRSTAAAPAAVQADGVAAGLVELSLTDGVADNIELGGSGDQAAEPGAGPQTNDAETQYSAQERAAYRRVRHLKEQIQHLEQRIVRKQEKLEFNQQQVAALQVEEQQALALAAAKQQQMASSSNSGDQISSSVAVSCSTHGDLLLQLAMQQSMQEMLKEVRAQLNSARSKVHNDTEALTKFEVDLQQLKQQEGDAVAALLAVQSTRCQAAEVEAFKSTAAGAASDLINVSVQSAPERSLLCSPIDRWLAGPSHFC